MKKILFLIVLFLLPSPFFYADIQTSAESSFYAKIQKDDVYMYATANTSSPLFIIPKTYFVKITAEENGCYLAQYRDIVGYVKKEEVTPMNGTPLTPFYIEEFRAFLPNGTGLYANPDLNSSSQLLTIPYLYSNLTFYGNIYGNSIPNKSNNWYYCKYEDQYGYVYSVFCDQIESPPINNESFDVISSPLFAEKEKVSSLSSTAMAFIIIGVSLPCLIVLYLLVKPNLMQTKSPKEKRSFKLRKRRDYFEFDEGDLT